MAKITVGKKIGTSKETSLIGLYSNTKSDYSTQDGNQTLGGYEIVGGFTADSTYGTKYVGETSNGREQFDFVQKENEDFENLG